jgi:outer membrane biosynthesis protein TonB
MSQAATSWQGLVVNGTYPLRRYLGGSSHSAVFLTELPARQPPEVAIKLVPIDPQLAESQLSRWKTAAGLGHRHLIRLLDMGRCRLDGVPHHYAVMEYADQTLDQLLGHRALSEDEAREMLLPALDALAFLHNMDFVQGQLKPTNILVVGDQLKLASDTIHRVGEDIFRRDTRSGYDPPEARSGQCSMAGDIWALGVTLVEALTRSHPSGLDGGEAIAPPADLPPTFREIVAQCLSTKPGDRPNVTQLRGWVRGETVSPPAETMQHATIEVPDLIVPAAPPPQPAIPKPVARPAPTQPPIREVSSLRSFLPLMLGALLILGLGWMGVRLFGSHGNPVQTGVQGPGNASLPQAVPMPAQVPADSSARSASSTGGADPTAPAGRVHEEIPDVPQDARRTIRGHIKVWVRVIIEQDGSVFGALADRAGPSRYFERLAIEAAKKWTFPPSDTPARRMMQVRFDFTRNGTTAHAVALPTRHDVRTVARRHS